MMKSAALLVFTLLVAAMTRASAQAPVDPRTTVDADFRAFIAQFEAATLRFVNGDASAWRALESHSDDVTVMNAFGVEKRGYAAVDKQYVTAASKFAPSPRTKLEFEYVAANANGNLGYTVAIQHNTVIYVGEDTLRHTATRTTNVFQREDGDWKLVHRHMDHLTPAPPGPPTK